MKKLLTIMTTVILTIGLFGTIAYANDWLNFDSEDKADQTEDNIEELMEIALEYKEGKISADDAVASLSDKLLKSQAEIVNLKDKITRLDDEIRLLKEQLKNADNSEQVKHLEKELKKANKATNNTFDRSEKALKKVKED